MSLQLELELELELELAIWIGDVSSFDVNSGTIRAVGGQVRRR